MNKEQGAIKEFEDMRNLAELKALSKYSLENPLTEKQYKRIMELKEKVLTNDDEEEDYDEVTKEVEHIFSCDA